MPGQRNVEVSIDVTFDEYTSLGKTKYIPILRIDDNQATQRQ